MSDLDKALLGYIAGILIVVIPVMITATLIINSGRA
ncbi:membrane protein [Gordonia phage Phistory]|uniref:Uncharacterized protein n=1 Tax=Gordonia phage Phistory TaxID=2301694 RepID=A0A385DZB2_9CAUD|nr:membrane protein [Gordonia phage Phistory]AXQ64806.1 hypothetical protein SEA_PHISTORY_101 [Gordonia phage Phistory]